MRKKRKKTPNPLLTHKQKERREIEDEKEAVKAAKVLRELLNARERRDLVTEVNIGDGLYLSATELVHKWCEQFYGDNEDCLELIDEEDPKSIVQDFRLNAAELRKVLRELKA